MTVGDKKLSVEHTLVNSKIISKILKCSSLTLLLGTGKRNEKYAIYGNWKQEKYGKEVDIIFSISWSTPNAIYVFLYIYIKKIISENEPQKP